MRHASIDTTMAYYVSIGADEVADELWGKFGSSEAGNRATYNNAYNNAPASPQETETAPAEVSTEAIEMKEVS